VNARRRNPAILPAMALFARLMFAVIACVCWGCSSAEQPPQAPASSAGAAATANALATFPAPGGLSFALAPGSCTESSCAPVVQLRQNGKVIDSMSLDFAASPPEFRQAMADPILGAGDPLEPTNLPAWTAGNGESMVTTAARAVKLSPTEAGLLVDQAGGFEHVKRRHYLFAAADNKLQRVWTGEEGAGPSWSATVLVDAADGNAQDIVYLTGFQPGGAEPDTVGATRYTWNAAQKTLLEGSPGPLFAVVAGDFPNLDTARSARAQPCVSNYSAVRAGDLGLRGSRIVLAAVTTRKSLAEAVRTQTEECPTGMTRQAVDVTLPAKKP
jgi:hypothetical protein